MDAFIEEYLRLVRVADWEGIERLMTTATSTIAPLYSVSSQIAIGVRPPGKNIFGRLYFCGQGADADYLRENINNDASLTLMASSNGGAWVTQRIGDRRISLAGRFQGALSFTNPCLAIYKQERSKTTAFYANDIGEFNHRWDEPLRHLIQTDEFFVMREATDLCVELKRKWSSFIDDVVDVHPGQRVPVDHCLQRWTAAFAGFVEEIRATRSRIGERLLISADWLPLQDLSRLPGEDVPPACNGLDRRDVVTINHHLQLQRQCGHNQLLGLIGRNFTKLHLELERMNTEWTTLQTWADLGRKSGKRKRVKAEYLQEFKMQYCGHFDEVMVHCLRKGKRASLTAAADGPRDEESSVLAIQFQQTVEHNQPGPVQLPGDNIAFYRP